MKRWALFCFPLLLLLACQKPIPERATWSGTIILAENQKLPLRLEIDFASSPPSGSFLVGEERTAIPEISRNGDSLSIILSEYGAAMHGKWDGKSWNGAFFRYRKDTVRLEFSASPEPAEPAKPAASSPPGVHLVGTFQVYYNNPDGIDSTTMAKFWTRGDSVFGTFIDPSGDHGLMVGTQSGTTARVGRFTGWQANLIELEQREGQWRGKYYARQFPPQVFSLVSRPSIPSKPLDPRRTRMRNPSAPFVFAGVTADGDSMRSSDPRFKGKALIVDIMGTWCHNCLDEAPLLEQLYKEYKDKGLEIIGLSFEVTNDVTVARGNLDIYRKRHGLTFPLVYSGSLDALNVDAKIHGQLEDFFAYPTSIFINKKGKVEHLHWGFKGPGTGEEYQQEVTRFYEYVQKLVRE
ncbi:MAG TPA: TlpA disulfide reductase family protein [Bacteroidota bacterium]|nr:TlpA disulfide reductase family protein [Bacteroidota bacterium]